MDLATTYEAIRISSGNSFVHETESQMILNGSRDISFTMDLVLKDIGLFQKIAEDHDVPLEISPLMIAATAITVVASIAYVLCAGPIYDFAARAGDDLLNPGRYIEAVLGSAATGGGGG